MKPTFLGHNNPLLTNMIIERTPAESIATMRNAIFDGADAFGFHLCQFPKEHRSVETLKCIFDYAEDKPILTMNYRGAFSEKDSEEERAEGLLSTIDAGATMVDVMGDYYDPSPRELTKNITAIDKQRRLIERVHEKGGEVLMSTHTWCFLTVEEAIIHAKEMESRGVDMIKIAMSADSEDELLEVIKITAYLKRELKIPFLLICMGQYGKMHRAIGPLFGSALVLCVQKYDTLSHKEQPLLRAERKVIDNLDWKPARNIASIHRY